MKKSYYFIDSEFFARSLHRSTLPSPYFKAMLTYPGWESTYPIFRYFQGREPITLLGNLFQCLKTPDILGTRPFLLHLKLIFSWSVSALSGHWLFTHSEALVTRRPPQPVSEPRAPITALWVDFEGLVRLSPGACISPAWWVEGAHPSVTSFVMQFVGF